MLGIVEEGYYRVSRNRGRDSKESPKRITQEGMRMKRRCRHRQHRLISYPFMWEKREKDNKRA